MGKSSEKLKAVACFRTFSRPTSARTARSGNVRQSKPLPRRPASNSAGSFPTRPFPKPIQSLNDPGLPPCWTNSAKTVLVELPDRFARDLAVQLAGHDRLRKEGVALIPASAPISSPKTRQRLFSCAKCWVREAYVPLRRNCSRWLSKRAWRSLQRKKHRFDLG